MTSNIISYKYLNNYFFIVELKLVDENSVSCRSLILIKTKTGVCDRVSKLLFLTSS